MFVKNKQYMIPDGCGSYDLVVMREPADGGCTECAYFDGRCHHDGNGETCGIDQDPPLVYVAITKMSRDEFAEKYPRLASIMFEWLDGELYDELYEELPITPQAEELIGTLTADQESKLALAIADIFENPQQVAEEAGIDITLVNQLSFAWSSITGIMQR